MKNRRLLNRILAGNISRQNLGMHLEQESYPSMGIHFFEISISSVDKEHIRVLSCKDKTLELEGKVLSNQQLEAVRKDVAVKCSKEQMLLWEEIKTYERNY